MLRDDTIYEEYGVATVINGVGSMTRVGGTRIRSEAADAMRNAANSFARISDLQARASELISQETGAEAGYVAAGAASCLTLATAACIAKHDLGVMDQLPDTTGIPAEVIIPHTHRNSYDHAIRAAGAQLVTVGNNDRTLGPGSNDLQPWELERAITSETVAIAFVARNQIPLRPITDTAHRHDIPVLVDAAGLIPPKDNLETFIRQGADAVVFSGGKAIRGPQSTGFVAGNRDLISSIALQHLDMDVVQETWNPPESLIQVESVAGVPRHGIGRGHKVGKEEIIGFLAAFELFCREAEESLYDELNARAQLLERRLETADALTCNCTDLPSGFPLVEVQVDEDRAGIGVVALVNELRQERPRVFVGDRHAASGTLTVHPLSLTDEEAGYLAERVLCYTT